MAGALLVAGCSQQEFARSVGRPGGQKLPPTLVSQKTDTAKKSRSDKLAEMLARWRSEPGSSRAQDYRVGAGDVLEVSITSLETPDRTTSLLREVSQEGLIALPFVGEVRCAERTPLEIEASLRKLYGARYIQDPQISVSVSEYRSRTVVVVGAVEKPGVYVLPRNGSNLLSILAQAGGVTKDAGDELSIVRPIHEEDAPADASLPAEGTAPIAVGKREITVNLQELLDRGNLALNVEVRNADIISVSREEPQYVCVLGYVRSPGSFTLKAGESMSVLRAVSLAGGLTPSSRAENSVLIRRTPEGRRTYPLDLTQLASGEGPAVYLEPEDTVIVGSGALAKFMEIFQPRVGASAGYMMAP
ncbi:MAG: SLBB domain-containing protein [Planctomycetota bacterium]